MGSWDIGEREKKGILQTLMARKQLTFIRHLLCASYMLCLAPYIFYLIHQAIKLGTIRYIL